MDPQYARKVGEIVAGIIVTDGEVHPAEESLLRRIMTRLGLSVHDEAPLEPMAEGADAAASLAGLPAEVRAEALELIIDTAIVDGKVVPAEQQYIEAVGAAMGATREQVQQHITDRLAEG